MSHTIYDHRGDVVCAYVADPDGRVGWIKRQNLQPLVEGLHYIREHTTVDKKRPLRVIAEMPEVVGDQAIRDGWLFDTKELKKWVNANPQFKYENIIY
tara:strand:- start:1607 stop:1900 length:294 start_codon:yes stop_codon:yes gene_type:complete